MQSNVFPCLFSMQYAKAVTMRQASLLFSDIRDNNTDPQWNITAGWAHEMPFVFLA